MSVFPVDLQMPFTLVTQCFPICAQMIWELESGQPRLLQRPGAGESILDRQRIGEALSHFLNSQGPKMRAKQRRRRLSNNCSCCSSIMPLIFWDSLYHVIRMSIPVQYQFAASRFRLRPVVPWFLLQTLNPPSLSCSVLYIWAAVSM